MFDFVQKHKRVLQVFLGLIAITFATWGIESYTRTRGGSDTAATVNGMSVSKREFETELRRQQERQQEQFKRMFGRGLDAESLDTPQIRKGLLDQLIAIRLATQGLAVPDELLADILSSDYVPASLMESIFKLRSAEVGISLPEAVRAASLTPARAVGLCDRGEISAGRRADLVRVRESEGAPVVRAVWRAGDRVV